MAGEEQAVQFLANLLALPHTIPAQAAAARQNRAMLEATNQMGHLGLTPEQLNAFAPVPSQTQFPGADVPVLGSVLRGVGTAGYLLQTALGNAPAAPRPPIKELAALSQQQALMDLRKQNESLAQQRFGETERHNRTMEGIAQERLARGGRGRGGGVAAEPPGEPLAPDVVPTVRNAYGMPKATPTVAPKPTTSVPSGNDPRDVVVQPPSATPPTPVATPEQTPPPGARQDKNGVIWVPSTRSGTGKTSWKVWNPKEPKAAKEAADKPLPAAVVQPVSHIQDVVRMLDELDGLLKQPEGQQAAGLLSGRLGRAEYALGVTQNPVADRINTLRERIQALGGAEMMRGVSRAKDMFDRLTVHLPQAGDELPLLQDKLVTTRASLANIAKLLVDSASQPASKTRASVDAMQAPPSDGMSGVTPSGNTFRVVE